MYDKKKGNLFYLFYIIDILRLSKVKLLMLIFDMIVLSQMIITIFASFTHYKDAILEYYT